MSYKDLQIGNRPVVPIDGGVWGTIIFDPNEGSPSFIGLHVSRSASQTTDDWRIYRFYRGAAGTGSITEIHIEHGSWSARTILLP